MLSEFGDCEEESARFSIVVTPTIKKLFNAWTKNLILRWVLNLSPRSREQRLGLLLTLVLQLSELAYACAFLRAF